MAITLLRQADGQYGLSENGAELGSIIPYRNSFHSGNCYLRLELRRYPLGQARDLFSRLRRELGGPLQVMAASPDTELIAFLRAGDFQRRRRCAERNVARADLASPLERTLPLEAVFRGTPKYDACCSLLYRYYAATHASVNPLTATPDMFARQLPETALCPAREEGMSHCAFVEENEIAYVATRDPAEVSEFVRAVAGYCFQRYDTITFECDDCDPAAMALSALFPGGWDVTWDTYVLP